MGHVYPQKFFSTQTISLFVTLQVIKLIFGRKNIPVTNKKFEG